jgi:hypothetical protein
MNDWFIIPIILGFLIVVRLMWGKEMFWTIMTSTVTKDRDIEDSND